MSASSQGTPCVPESNRPSIVCLIGSARFKHAFEIAARREALSGKIVLQPVWAPGGVRTEEERALLFTLHRAKIDLADEVLVINCGGYVGNDTLDEMTYAGSRGKEISFLEHGAMRT